MCCGFVAGDEDLLDHRDELLGRQRPFVACLVLETGRDQVAADIVLRCAPALVADLNEIVLRFDDLFCAPDALIGGCHARKLQRERVRPGAEVVAVGAIESERITDHVHGQQIRELGLELAAAIASETVQELMDHGLDVGVHGRHSSLGECAAGELLVARVDRWVGSE